MNKPTFANRERLLVALSNEFRLKMLTALCDGEPRGASELAQIAGCSTSSGSKHAKVLADTGLCVQGRGQLYRIAPGIQVTPGKGELEFGHCLLRLDYQAGS